MTYLDVLRNLQQRGVRDDDDSNFVLKRKVERRSSTIAVSERGNPGNTACLESSKDLADTRFGNIGTVGPEPRHEVKVGSRVEGIRRAWLVENVGDDDLEAVAGVVVGEELMDRMRVSVEFATKERGSGSGSR